MVIINNGVDKVETGNSRESPNENIGKLYGTRQDKKKKE